ncbi:accessory gland protein Acp29AB-like [Drosophila rhopaloa]|uniref:Accessory gland protein Acp29AB-like n=1 Tax=Drosophila rhopaloa TaxID=1041015 RepID=A0A6P4E2E5_DRORH|nr:accessory gland protein Acp29AB-like [Drosophila rhopaloa]
MLKSSIYFFLAFLSFNLYGSLAESQDNGRSVCLVNDPPNQCGKFCLEALKPMLDHIAFHQKEWSTCNPQKQNETQERLVRIEAKIDKLLDQKEASSTNANILDLHTKLNRIENLLAGLQKNVAKRVPNASISPLFTRIGSRLIYIEKEIKKSWDAAEETCREMGGHLATIQNESDFTAIKDGLSQPKSYWLGISDVAKEGEFVSVATGKLAPFLKWEKDQPNNLFGKDNCVDLYRDEMYDSDCSGNQYFICEAIG